MVFSTEVSDLWVLPVLKITEHDGKTTKFRAFSEICSVYIRFLCTGFVPFFRNNFPGLFQDFSRLRIDFSRTPKFTLTLSKFYYFIQFNRFPGLSSPGKCDNKIPGLSRISRTHTNPVCSANVNLKGCFWLTFVCCQEEK